MNRRARPLNDGAYALLPQVAAQFITPIRFKLVVLIDIEMAVIGVGGRRQSQFGQVAEAGLVV